MVHVQKRLLDKLGIQKLVMVTLIARDTVDQDFAQNRQRFLAEQGYSYTILDASSLVE